MEKIQSSFGTALLSRVTGEDAFAVAKLLISKLVPDGGTNVDHVLCLVFDADGKTIVRHVHPGCG